jgi:hypothetical protein
MSGENPQGPFLDGDLISGRLPELGGSTFFCTGP